ncbi:MAG: ACT domain-containing protein [Oscillospiraceae bacterium]|nr:ACT domain-containing protein [Oscillospiraceae bacterium]
MKLEILEQAFSVCKTASIGDMSCKSGFCFIARTDEENSLVCPTEEVPEDTIAREDGFRGLRVEGTLDFSLIGILAGICGILAERRIGVFVVSTFNTDYIFVRAEDLEKAVISLEENGYEIGKET